MTELRLNVAAFVKTQGLSPIKTRLARHLGERRADAFYQLACTSIRDVLVAAEESAAPLTAHWAVAEARGLKEWSDLPTLLQGEGGLGERLDLVYQALLRDGAAAVVIGADAPQMEPGIFADVRRAFEGGADFVLGPATDGGFYLFAGRRPIPREIWLAVPYSVSTTAAELGRRVEKLGRLTRLTPLTDVDTADDLVIAGRELAKIKEPTPGQNRLMAWLARGDSDY